MLRLLEKRAVALLAVGCLFAFVAPVRAADCSVTLANNVGDSISVSALLHSTDADDYSEGEPLGVASSGGELSATVSPYELWFPLQPFKATQSNETITGTITGSDGDETCTFLASNAPQAFKYGLKTELEEVNESIRRIGLLFMTARHLCDTGKGNPTFCALHFQGSSLATDFAAYLAGLDAAALRSTSLVSVHLPAGLSFDPAGPPDALGDTFHALKENTKKIVSLELTIAAAMSRANAAFSGGGPHPRRAERNVLAVKRELGQAMLDQASLSEALSQAVTDAGADVTIASSDVAAAQASINDGLTGKQAAHLEKLGASPSDVPILGAAYLQQDPNSFSGTFASILVDSTYLQSLQTLGQDLAK
jgi:hypothetical protein